MKSILTTILDTIRRDGTFRYVETNWGQLNYDSPAVSFPCCLVDIGNLEYEQLSHLHQTAACTVSFTVATSILDNMPYEIFDLIEHLHTILQGLCSDSFQPLQRTSCSHSTATKDVDSYTITYTTAFTVSNTDIDK